MFIAPAIHSVLSDTDDSVELIVMDGASTDGSVSVLEELARLYGRRLSWWSQADDGPADAVNKAVAEARGQWLGWLNSDDMYAPGALGLIQPRLRAASSEVMVYGHGEHVDEDGRFLELYPTQTPDTPVAAFADGCFICQPTVFLRRDVFLSMGGLDTSLRAAFDFDLWVRMFQARPDAIGFIDAVLARSRLHAGGITARFRERVALEGLRVLRQHLGVGPAHWLLTHFEELCSQHPFHGEALSLAQRCQNVVEKARGLLDHAAVQELNEAIARDRRIALADTGVNVGVHADGWAPDDLEVRLRQGSPPVRALRLQCRHHAPGGGGTLRITVAEPDGRTHSIIVDGNGTFDLSLSAHCTEADAQLIYRIHTDGAFVPAQVEPGSGDHRALAFLVEACTPQY